MWKDIIGHKKEVHQLVRAVERDQLAHAYLFAGIDGIGKRLVAETLATALVCESGPLDACGSCTQCKKALGGNHPDIIHLGVEEEKTQIRIDQVREVQRRLKHRPFEGRFQTVVVDNAELMNAEASNAFLKTLEEPAQRTLLILISSRPHTILPTIRSRCQEISFSPLPIKEVAMYIKERGGLTEEEAFSVASLTQGSLGNALGFPLLTFANVTKRIKVLLKNPFPEMVLATAEEWAGDGKEYSYILQILRGWFRDMLILNSGVGEDALVIRSCAEEIREASKRYEKKRLLKILGYIKEAEDALDTTYNKQLMFEQLLFNLFS